MESAVGYVGVFLENWSSFNRRGRGRSQTYIIMYVCVIIMCLVHPVCMQVQGIGVPNKFRLRSLLGARIPLNATYSPLISMYNPFNASLQVSSIVQCNTVQCSAVHGLYILIWGCVLWKSTKDTIVWSEDLQYSTLQCNAVQYMLIWGEFCGKTLLCLHWLWWSED